AESLRAVSQIEADIVLARLSVRQKKYAEAADLLERAFVAHRKDPWPLPELMAHAMRLPVEVAEKDRALGARMYEVMKQPFAVHCLDESRQNVVIELALRVDMKRLCVEALAPFERFPSWKRDFLAGRLDCYKMTGSPLVERAARDLRDFLREEPLPFASGL